MKNKLFVAIIILLSISCIVISILNYNDKVYTIIGETTIVHYKNKKINKIEYVDYINKKYSYDNYKIYYNGSFINGTFNVTDNLESLYEIYNENYEQIYPYPFIAYKGDINMNLYNQSINEPNDSDNVIISKVLKENSLESNYTNFKKISYDVDNDGMVENIYYVDNERNNSSIYFLTFISKNNNTIILEKNIVSMDKINEESRKKLSTLIDIDLDGKYEIMFSESSGDDSRVYYHFYKFDSNTNSVNEIK